jgi:hypothetical protein
MAVRQRFRAPDTEALTIPAIGISFSLGEIWQGLHNKRSERE